MKSAPFAYHAPTTTEEALALKTDLGGDARILAGGQSLMPLMHFRLATPSALIDINRLDDLANIGRSNGTLTIGAVVRQSDVLTSTEAASAAPLLVEATGHIGHAQIRHRGTLAGSAAHADPSAEIPAVLMALGAEMVCASKGQQRTVSATEFYAGPFETVLGDDEVLTAIHVPATPDGTGSAWVELTRIYNGFPVVGAGAVVTMADGVIANASVGLCGLAATPTVSDAAADVLTGATPSPDLAAGAAAAAIEALEPPGDVHGSTSYRKRAGRAIVARAIAAAIERAGGTT